MGPIKLSKKIHTAADLYAQLIIASELKKNALEYGCKYIRTHLRQKDHNILRLYYIRIIIYGKSSILIIEYSVLELIEP